MTRLDDPLVRFACTARDRGVSLTAAWALWLAIHEGADFRPFVAAWNDSALYASVPTR